MSKRKDYDNLDLGSLLKSPGYGSATPLPMSLDPITRQKLSVTLEQLQPFALNPRQSRNPMYEDIKASILQRGLDAPPPISRRPGDEHYVIVNGGNTRLAILNELWLETKDRRFFEIECDFIPWVSDAHALTGHLIENDQRGEMTFIDRARAIQRLRQLWEQAQGDGASLSQRELARRLTDAGYRVSHTLINRIFFTLEFLDPCIPNVLNAGLGKPQIERLIKLRTACQQAWQATAPARTQDEFAIAFDFALSDCDRYAEDWSYDLAQDDVLRGLARHLECAYGDLVVEVEKALYQGSATTVDAVAHPVTLVPSPATPAAPPPPAAVPGQTLPAQSSSRVPELAMAARRPLSDEPVPASPLRAAPSTSTADDPLDLLSEHVAALIEDRVDGLSAFQPVLDRLHVLVHEGAKACELPGELLILDVQQPLGFTVLNPAYEMTVEQTRYWWLLRLITEPTDTTPEGMIALSSQMPWANPLMLLFAESGWAPMASAATIEILVLARRCRAERDSAR